MNKTFTYQTSGICSREITVSCQDGKIMEANFKGGCHGNLLGINALIKGMPVEEVISRLKGINCGKRGTSCPDQLAKALELHM